MSKRILSLAIAMLMLLPLVFSFASCEKERTEEEIINDIVNSGTTALTLSVWIPTNSDADSQEFKARLSAVQDKINEIFRDKNLSTEIELTAISSAEYEAKLDNHLAEIEARVEAKKGLLPSNVSQGYVNKAVKIPYGDSYMYELAYPKVLDTQIDLFMIRNYDEYKALVQKQNLYALDSYLSTDGRYGDIRKMISPSVFAQYVIDKSTYAIPNNHQYTDANYQYMLIDKAAFDLVEGADINAITDIFSCESLINAIGANAESGFIPFVGTLNDAPGVYMFDESDLIGSSVAAPNPSSILDVEAYTKYVELYKKLTDNKYAKAELAEGEKSAVSFFYGTNEDVKAYEENYYIVKTEKPVANSDEIFSSMFAISKYSANYDRAMRVLYLLQTDADIITLLQYGIENEDYTLELDDDGNEIIQATDDCVYDMNGLNIGNSYLTYKDYDSMLDEWGTVKESNYDLVVNPYINFLKNFDANATEDEKSQLSTLTASVKALAEEVNADINAMSSEAYVAFIEAYNELATVYPEIAKLEGEISGLKEAMKPNQDRLAELEALIPALIETLKPNTDKLAELEAELAALKSNEEPDEAKIKELEDEIAYINGLLNPTADKLTQLEADLAAAKEQEVEDNRLIAKLESEIEIVKNATNLKAYESEANNLAEALKPNEEKLAELEEKLAPLTEKKNTLEAESPSASKLQLSEDYKALLALYTDFYNKYN